VCTSLSLQLAYAQHVEYGCNKCSPHLKTTFTVFDTALSNFYPHALRLQGMLGLNDVQYFGLVDYFNTPSAQHDAPVLLVTCDLTFLLARSSTAGTSRHKNAV